LFWGIWTLKYNLKTEKYKDTFLDAYGRETLNLDKLEVCRLLAGLTG
jgi:kanamycin kinase